MISSVYNYYLSTYAGQQLNKYDTHKSSELKDVCKSIIKSNRKLPLYKIKNSENIQKYAIDLKETARSIQNIAAALSDDASSIEGFTRKKAGSSNTRIAEAVYIGGDNGQEKVSDMEGNNATDETGRTDELEIYVKNLATPQINQGRLLNPDKMGLKPGIYKFELNIQQYSYEFQFKIGDKDTNGSVANRLSRLINRSNVGLVSGVKKSDDGRIYMDIRSEATGRNGFERDVFTITHSDDSMDSGDVVEYFGMNSKKVEARNANFIINGVEKDTMANKFIVENKYEITLKGESVTEKDVAKIGIKPDFDAVIENVSDLLDCYNSIVDLAISQDNGSYESGKLLREIRSMTDYNKAEMDAAGFVTDKDGHIKIEESLLIQSENEGTLKESLYILNNFKNSIVEKAKNISINPMNYVDKKVIAYKNPVKSYPSPYVSSIYSGMMFDDAV